MTSHAIRLSWHKYLFLIITVALVIAVVGLAWLPIEAHEAFVLLAAQHMLDSHDWVIPYFNGDPHLTKPPLSYWLTMITAWLSNGGLVEAWHGRLPSALAGVGIVAVTAWSGRKLFDDGIGLLAGVILATSSGYFYYTHSARPEMLYALCCNLAILAYLYMRDDSLSTCSRIWLTHAIWLAFALATLTKGPHIPAVLLLAFITDHYWRGRSLRQAVVAMHPLTGLLLVAVIVAPWWWLLHHRLGGNGLHGTQLSGSLLTVNPLKLLSPYYLYRPLQLLLPWILFLPCLVHFFRKPEYKPHIRLLILLIVLPALVLSFGPQKRWYYMLPAMLPMSIMLAAGIMTYLRQRPLNGMMPKFIGGFALVSALLFVAAGCSKWPWGIERFEQARVAHAINRHSSSNTQVLNWDVTPEIYAFYSRRSIIRVQDTDDIRTQLSSAPAGNLLLIMQTKDVPQLPTDLHAYVLEHTNGGNSDNVPTALVHISTAPWHR